MDEGLHPNWSKWQPSDTSIEGGAAEIAEKVGAEYRHPDGKQLVLVTGAPLLIPRRAPACDREHRGGRRRHGHLPAQRAGDELRRSISASRPCARLKVLQREALELALYTFRYLPDVEGVVTLLPPPPAGGERDGDRDPHARRPGRTVPRRLRLRPTATSRNAIFYRPGDLKPQLQMPLGNTLAAQAPTADSLRAAEAKAIDTLTLSNRFIASVPDPPGTFLVLDRPTTP